MWFMYPLPRIPHTRRLVPFCYHYDFILIGSMGLVYLPTFSKNQPFMYRYIYHFLPWEFYAIQTSKDLQIEPRKRWNYRTSYGVRPVPKINWGFFGWVISPRNCQWSEMEVSLNGGTPIFTPQNHHFLVGKPMVVGETPHFRRLPNTWNGPLKYLGFFGAHLFMASLRTPGKRSKAFDIISEAWEQIRFQEVAIRAITDFFSHHCC